jgi:hypothetical protein
MKGKRKRKKKTRWVEYKVCHERREKNHQRKKERRGREI